MGVPKESTFVLEDGEVLELGAGGGSVVDRVAAGRVLVNGNRLWGADSKVLNERRRLAGEGVVAVSMTVDGQSGTVLRPPNLASYGFMEM